MDDSTLTNRRWWRRLPARLTIRMSMALVLLLGVGIAWVVHLARVQRLAVASILNAGGKVYYEWEITPARARYFDAWRPNPKGRPSGPRWLVDLLGPDYFGSVRVAYLSPKVDDEMMGHVGQLDHLEDLIVEEAPALTDGGMASLRRLTRLRSFILSKAPGVTGAALGWLSGATWLQRLSLEGVPVVDGDIAFLAQMKDLADLSLNGGRLTDGGLVHLDGLINLRVLRLDGNPVTGSGLMHLGGMTRLAILNLNGTRVDDLAGIRRLDQLEVLALRDCPIGDTGLAPVVGMGKLKNLLLAHTAVTDAGLAHLAGLPSLARLDLEGTRVTDAGLAGLSGLRSLKHVEVRDTGISDAGIKALTLALPSAWVTVGGSKAPAHGPSPPRRPPSPN